MTNLENTLPGRDEVMPISGKHFVNGNTITKPFPGGIELAYFGMGCFWGAEKVFWLLDGVYSTAVGYSGGQTKNADYHEVCSGQTGHTEVVLVAFDPLKIRYPELLTIFWENHNPTQGMRQGNDMGTQYRSSIYTNDDAQADAAEKSRDSYQAQLTSAGYPEITTEISPVGDFFYAEEFHQQYLARNPGGYCGLGGTGVTCPIGVATA
jgi:peptide-methionine (S)-S-oxide reductase